MDASRDRSALTDTSHPGTDGSTGCSALCFHAVPALSDTTEAPRPDGIETKEAAWYAAPAALANLVMHPAMRLRLHDPITQRVTSGGQASLFWFGRVSINLIVMLFCGCLCCVVVLRRYCVYVFLYSDIGVTLINICYKFLFE